MRGGVCAGGDWAGGWPEVRLPLCGGVSGCDAEMSTWLALWIELAALGASFSLEVLTLGSRSPRRLSGAGV